PGRQRQAPCSAARAGAAEAGPARGGRLRRALAEGPAHARAPARCEGDRGVGPGALDSPPPRAAGRRSADGGALGEAAMRWRDLKAGELRPGHVGERLALAGWVARRRDHGGLVFIDLRDESGLAQLVINPERAPAAAEVAHGVRNEFVVRAE